MVEIQGVYEEMTRADSSGLLALALYHFRTIEAPSMTILRMAFQKLDLEKLIPLTSRKTCEVKCLLHAFQFVTFNFRFGSIVATGHELPFSSVHLERATNAKCAYREV